MSVVDLLERAQEIEVAVVRGDGSAGRWTPIWVVVVDGSAYVRTWHRRTTGWYGGVLRTGRARIRVGGRVAEVSVTDVRPAQDDSLASAVSAAYESKYSGPGAVSVVTPDAVATTLRLGLDVAGGS